MNLLGALLSAPVVQFKECFSRSSYIKGDPQTQHLTLILLPNEYMSLFSDNNFCQNSDRLSTVAKLDFLAGGTSITVDDTYMVGSYVYQFNKQLEIEFDLSRNATLYADISISSQASYSVSFDNALITGGLTRISHTKFNASSCWQSVNYTYAQDGSFVVDVQPNSCLVQAPVVVNLIARLNGQDIVLKMDYITDPAFSFTAHTQYIPQPTLLADANYIKVFKEFLKKSRELQMQFELTFTDASTNISSYVKQEVAFKKPQGSPATDYHLSLYVQTKQLKYVFEKNVTDPFRQLMTNKRSAGITKFNCTFTNTLDGNQLQDTATFAIDDTFRMGYFEIVSSSSKYLKIILKTQEILAKTYITFLDASGNVESEHIVLKNLVRSAINYEAFYWKPGDRFMVRMRTYRNYGFYDIEQQTYSFQVYYDEQQYADFQLPTQPFRYLNDYYVILNFSCADDRFVSDKSCAERVKLARKLTFKDVTKFTLISQAENQFNLTHSPYSSLNDELLMLFLVVAVVCFVLALVLLGVLIWWEKKR